MKVKYLLIGLLATQFAHAKDVELVAYLNERTSGIETLDIQLYDKPIENGFCSEIKNARFARLSHGTTNSPLVRPWGSGCWVSVSEEKIRIRIRSFENNEPPIDMEISKYLFKEGGGYNENYFIAEVEENLTDEWDQIKPLYIFIDGDKKCFKSEYGMLASPWGNQEAPEERREISKDQRSMVLIGTFNDQSITKIHHYKSMSECEIALENKNF